MNNIPKYNPKIHHRKSIRLAGYDYSNQGMYFITICCHKKEHRFGKIENGEMILNELGEIADNEWIDLLKRFPDIELDSHQIMPNHMHGIIVIKHVDNTGANDVGAGFTPALESGNDFDQNSIKDTNQPIPIILGNIIGAYKSLVFNKCLDIHKSKNTGMGKFWQRNYFEHIIRNKESYHTISEYIINNVTNWDNDKFYSK